MPGPSSLLDGGVLTQMLACDVCFPGSLSWHSLSVRQRHHCFLLHVDGSVTAISRWQEELRHIKIWSRDVAFQAFYSLTPNSFPAVSPLGCQVGTCCRDMAWSFFHSLCSPCFPAGTSPSSLKPFTLGRPTTECNGPFLMPLFFKPSHWLGGCRCLGRSFTNLKHFACGREDEGQVREYESGLGSFSTEVASITLATEAA